MLRNIALRIILITLIVQYLISGVRQQSSVTAPPLREEAKPGTSDRYKTLARMHRQAVALAASLATRLRLTPSSKLDKRTPTDGELPVA
jgi:hypothetical protein